MKKSKMKGEWDCSLHRARELEPHARKSVKSVMSRGGRPCEVLAALAAGSKLGWTVFEWQTLLDELDACTMSVADYLMCY
jgi:hypothetical protein